MTRSAFLGNYDTPTDPPPTDRRDERTDRVIGKFHIQKYNHNFTILHEPAAVVLSRNLSWVFQVPQTACKVQPHMFNK